MSGQECGSASLPCWQPASPVQWRGLVDRSIEQVNIHLVHVDINMWWVSKWAMLVIRDDILLIYLLCKLMLMRIRWTKCIYLQSLFDDRERAQSQFASNPLKIAIRCARCSLLACGDRSSFKAITFNYTAIYYFVHSIYERMPMMILPQILYVILILCAVLRSKRSTYPPNYSI